MLIKIVRVKILAAALHKKPRSRDKSPQNTEIIHKKQNYLKRKIKKRVEIKMCKHNNLNIIEEIKSISDVWEKLIFIILLALMIARKVGIEYI